MDTVVAETEHRTQVQEQLVEERQISLKLRISNEDLQTRMGTMVAPLPSAPVQCAMRLAASGNIPLGLFCD
eukprot:361873-Prorocentrum_minimum.AAC.1